MLDNRYVAAVNSVQHLSVFLNCENQPFGMHMQKIVCVSAHSMNHIPCLTTNVNGNVKTEITKNRGAISGNSAFSHSERIGY